MSLVATNEVAGLIDGKRHHGRITSETDLVTSPLDESFNTFSRARANTNLSLDDSQVGICLEVLVELFEGNVHTRRELVEENVSRKACSLRFF